MKEILIPLTDLMAEKLHHAQNFVAQNDRQPDRAAEPFGGGDRCAGKLPSVTTSGIQAALQLAQMRPGRPIPCSNVRGG